MGAPFIQTPSWWKIAIGSSLYTGFIPIAPATFSSLLIGIPLVLLFHNSLPLYASVTLLIFFLGVYIARELSKVWGEDPRRVTIDEICGIMVTFFLINPDIKRLILGFILFRFFDIVKLPFIKSSEKIGGGFGVMVDDVIAGAISNIVLRIIW